MEALKLRHIASAKVDVVQSNLVQNGYLNLVVKDSVLHYRAIQCPFDPKKKENVVIHLLLEVLVQLL